MKVMFQNHASLLIEYDGHYLLTDPWYNQPAFGSWLPSFASYVHPTYLAALKDKLTILISHGHDDHFDDRLLSLFDKNITIITASFKAPSVVNRLKKLGFHNIITVGEDEQTVNGLDISSFVVNEISHDDATYLIRHQDGAVIHANDNWRVFSSKHLELIKQRVSHYPTSDVLLFSQTNSASGYPLNYDCFSEEEQDSILRKKVAQMVEGGLKNAEELKLDRLFSYAGYATPYVRNKNYGERGFFPTAKFLEELLLSESISSPVGIEDFKPGDYVQTPGGHIVKAFVTGYEDAEVKEATHKFYEKYGNIDECISYRKLELADDNIVSWVDDFLNEFDRFVQKRVQGPDSHFTDVIGKTFKLTITFDDYDKSRTIKFGAGIVDVENEPNKQCIVDCRTIYQVLKGKALFEDLYTGYNARWNRFPSNVYNKDIVQMMVMFSYVYRNRLASEYCKKWEQPINV